MFLVSHFDVGAGAVLEEQELVDGMQSKALGGRDAVEMPGNFAFREHDATSITLHGFCAGWKFVDATQDYVALLELVFVHGVFNLVSEFSETEGLKTGCRHPLDLCELDAVRHATTVAERAAHP